jgi:hypothetical protein
LLWVFRTVTASAMSLLILIFTILNSALPSRESLRRPASSESIFDMLLDMYFCDSGISFSTIEVIAS